jgi:hypothetical protein
MFLRPDGTYGSAQCSIGFQPVRADKSMSACLFICNHFRNVSKASLDASKIQAGSLCYDTAIQNKRQLAGASDGTRSCAIRRCMSRRHFRYCPANPRTVRGCLPFLSLLDVRARIARERCIPQRCF